MTNKIGKAIPAKKNLYLEGTHTRRFELRFACRVFWEFLRGIRKMYFVGPCITVFGSARFKEDNIYYKAAQDFGAAIAKFHFTTVTGGGPGIMEAANRGAFGANGKSIGMNIVLPHEQHENPYLTTSITFTHFFTRKVMLVKYSYAFVIMPGGFGTMDEFFETITLIQTKTNEHFPIVLYGVSYYKPLMHMINEMVKEGTIAQEDLKLVLLTDSVEEGMTHIKKFLNEKYHLLDKRKPLFLLGES